ncbi:MAG: hypothetical protein RR396_04365 [Clostridiales bacterium]
MKVILQGKNGMSLVFVLCVILLLMAISTSILVAASTAAGSNASQRTYDQLNIYTDSVIKTLMYSLQQEEIDINNPQYLGIKLLRAIYDAKAANPDAPQYPQKLNMDFGINAIQETAISDLDLRFFAEDIMLQPEQPAHQEENEDGSINTIERIPAQADVNIKMEVKFSTTVKKRSINNLLVFELKGASLEDNGSAANMLIKEAGEWRLISNEKFDS